MRLRAYLGDNELLLSYPMTMQNATKNHLALIKGSLHVSNCASGKKDGSRLGAYYW